MALHGNVSSIGQKMQIDYVLDALNDHDYELKIRESKPKNLNEAYTRALRLEMIRKEVLERELVEDAPVKHGKHMRAVEVDVTRSPLNLKYQRMIEKMQMSEQKRTEESKAANQKKVEEKLAAMALAQKSAQLQQLKVEKRLVAMVSEQNAVQLWQQMTLTDEVKRSAPAKPDYSNLKFFSCRMIGHSANICKLPKKSMPTVADRNCFHCHQKKHFRRNFPMLTS